MEVILPSNPALCINNGDIRFMPWQRGMKLYSKFTPEQFSLINPDCHSDSELDDHIERCNIIMTCWIVSDAETEITFGFVYTLYEPLAKYPTVSVHGGSWLSSFYTSRKIIKAYLLLIEQLLNLGYKVWTETTKNNSTVIRLSKHIGFVKYREDQEKIYFWINSKRLTQSSIYKKLVLRNYINEKS